jgi:predicted DCC family thiol-disulfide oxidoreductase YuxK
MTGTCVYDGDCGICTRLAGWVAAHSDCGVVPSQSLDLAAAGLTEEQVATSVWWLDSDGRPAASGAAAIAAVLRTCGPPWRWIGRYLQLPVIRTIAELKYRVIARFRYRLPGGTDACRIDQPPVTRD